MVPLEKAPKAVITGIEITHHRLKLDPPFRASWDTQPRTQFDAGAVRARVGNKRNLAVDCSQGWRVSWDAYPSWSLKDAVQVARELERVGVYWMEEPLHRGDREGMRRLRDKVDIRIAGGEMTRELYEFRDLISEGCLDVLQPDAALVGGITGLRRVAAMAQEHNLVFTPHTWTNGMGVVANAHLTAGLCDAPFLEFPYDPPEWDVER